MPLQEEKRYKSIFKVKKGNLMIEKCLKFGWDLCCFEKRSGVKLGKKQRLFIEITQSDI